MNLHLTAATKKEKSFLDKLTYFVGVVFPLATIPQIIEVYGTQDSSGVSLWTWALYAVLQFALLLWAIADSIKQLIISYTLWMVMYAVLIIGIVIYR